ncbi:hypothetical protein CLG96_07485 [Sphingomonas oleivorans]|uniref:SH3b domain-containing protein n=1 Tax=Sphingomonas oleivorans TaxID=1735121 RepID=A0A2T5G077_9SPHN|nr:SH3 domain-containing protein [Sphingomonas oleivorans]PTQ12363.1 hypothetical protein CLG96_07485 [Sphingomonas oleivorans]
MRVLVRTLAVMAMIAGTAQASAAPDREVPYWASIAAGDAMMRTGPGGNFPAVWRYRRADLPIRVLQVHQSWRRIESPDGVQGWMAVALLSARRTAIVTGEIRPMLARPEEGAKIVWRAEPGVVGRIDQCAAGWCRFDVRGKAGYIRTAHIWGVDPNEVID